MTLPALGRPSSSRVTWNPAFVARGQRGHGACFAAAVLVEFQSVAEGLALHECNLKCCLQKIKSTCISQEFVIYKAPNFYLEMQACVDSACAEI